MLCATKGLILSASLGAAVLIAACGKGDRGAGDTMAARGGDSTGAAMTAAPGAAGTRADTGAMGGMAAGTMTDPQIMAAISQANEGEISAGRMAETKATNANVKAFARQMVADHSRLLDQGRSLAKQLNVTPAPAPNDTLVAHNQASAAKLQAAAKGMAFDTTYINGQVMDHQMVLAMLKSFDGKAQHAQLNTMIKNAQPIIQQHLTRAQSIQGNLK